MTHKLEATMVQIKKTMSITSFYPLNSTLFHTLDPTKTCCKIYTYFNRISLGLNQISKLRACWDIRRLVLLFGRPVCVDRISNCPLDRVLTYKNLIYLLNLQISRSPWGKKYLKML